MKTIKELNIMRERVEHLGFEIVKAQQTFLAYYKQILDDCPELRRNA